MKFLAQISKLTLKSDSGRRRNNFRFGNNDRNRNVLDRDLDQYMMKSNRYNKSRLDDDIDQYMSKSKKGLDRSIDEYMKDARKVKLFLREQPLCLNPIN